MKLECITLKAKLTEQHKLMAYVLSRQFGYTMTDIGKLMKVSQPTISQAIKEVEYWKTIRDLQQELWKIKQYLLDNGYKDPAIPQLP